MELVRALGLLRLSASFSLCLSPSPPRSLSPSHSLSHSLTRCAHTQVLILPNFHDFPSDALTVEFWMNSIDTCRPGVPFSYAHGEYEKQDNSFLIFNYNSFGVSDGV